MQRAEALARYAQDTAAAINRLIRLRWMVRILYPDAFPEDLRPSVRDFFTRCNDQAPSVAKPESLLKTGA